MSAEHQPGQPWGDEFSVSGMKAASDCTQKQMPTIQPSLLFCLPEKTGQFIAVMVSGLVNPSCNASESCLAWWDLHNWDPGVLPNPPLLFRKFGHVSINSKFKAISDGLLWHSRVERLKKFYKPLLKTDISCGAQCWQLWLGQKNIPSCPRLTLMIQWSTNKQSDGTKAGKQEGVGQK